MNKIIHTYKHYLSLERDFFFTLVHATKYWSMAFMSRGAKKFGFETLIAPICKLFLVSTVFQHFSVYGSSCQIQQV